jgi:hypothetical protein
MNTILQAIYDEGANCLRRGALGLVLFCAACSANATIDLDFGESDLSSELAASGTMSYTTAITTDGFLTAIYAQVVAETSFSGDGTSGSVGGDIYISQAGDTTTTYSLTLYQDSALTQIYSPSTDFSFDLFFYDIEGSGSSSTKYYEEITIYTASTAEYLSTTALTITKNTDGSVTASAYGTGLVDSSEGLDAFNGTEQANAAISFTFENTSTVVFDYTVVNEWGNGAGRTLLLDGNNLSFDGFTTETIEVVPEPMSALLICLAGSVCLFVRRRFIF